MDLLSMLICDIAEVGLAGSWWAWRHQFPPAGLGLPLLAVFGCELILSLDP